MSAKALCTDAIEPSTPAGAPTVRVLAVIPGTGEGICLLAARRQVESLRSASFTVESHFFDTRKSPFAFLNSCRRLRAAVRATSPDIVHVHYGTVTALVCTLLLSAPIVVTFRGSDLNPEPGIGWLRTRLSILCSQLAVLGCGKVVCVSRQLAGKVWWRKSRVEIIPSGIDLQSFHVTDRLEARRLLGWSVDERVILFNAGNAPAVKGMDLAEAVFTRVARREKVRIQIMRGDVPPERVPLLMCAADCLLVTSRSEGSPNIVKEALACALPVVSVDVGDVKERLVGVSPSYLVSRDPDEIADAVTKILFTRQRSNGRKAAEALSHTQIARRWAEVYESLRRPRRGLSAA